MKVKEEFLFENTFKHLMNWYANSYVPGQSVDLLMMIKEIIGHYNQKEKINLHFWYRKFMWQYNFLFISINLQKQVICVYTIDVLCVARDAYMRVIIMIVIQIIFLIIFNDIYNIMWYQNL